jgi:hypothetical protein
MTDDTLPTSTLGDLETDRLLNELVRLISDSIEKHGNEANINHILETVKIVVEHDNAFRLGTSDPDNFMTMEEIESLFISRQQRLKDIGIKDLLGKMKKMDGEAAIIAKKKRNTSGKE